MGTGGLGQSQQGCVLNAPPGVLRCIWLARNHQHAGDWRIRHSIYSCTGNLKRTREHCFKRMVRPVSVQASEGKSSAKTCVNEKGVSLQNKINVTENMHFLL